MNDLRVAIFQVSISWENPQENCSCFSNLLDLFYSRIPMEKRPDILVFPEFFTTGFSMNPAVVETASGISTRWMLETASKYNVAIVGSVPIKDGDSTFNRALFVMPDGKIEHYDKRHVFRMGGEIGHYSPGDSHKIVNFRGWNIALNICYDLRFPVWSRNCELKYDLMLNVASWPDSRIAVTDILTKARAIENIAYFAFANRVGEDPENRYNGHSRIVNYKGEDIGEIINIAGTDIMTASVSMTELLRFREKFPAWMDADEFILFYF